MKKICAIDRGQTHIEWFIIEDKTIVRQNSSNLGAINILTEGGKDRFLEQLAIIKEDTKDEGIDIYFMGSTGVGKGRADYDLTLKLMNDILPAPKSMLFSDPDVLFAANFPKKGGTLLHAGTGNFAVMESEAGDYLRTGGWGYILGGEGAGYNLGLSAMREVCKSFDGLTEDTILKEDFLKYLNIEEELHIRPVFYSDKVDKQFIAHFTKIVCQRAEEGDKIALKVVKEATKSLASLLIPAKKILKSDNFTVKYVGSLVEKNLFYQKMVEEEVKKIYPKANFELATGNFTDAAIALTEKE